MMQAVVKRSATQAPRVFSVFSDKFVATATREFSLYTPAGKQVLTPFTIQKRSMSSPKDMADAEVNEIFNLWNDALATLDPDTVAARYAKDSILLPTVSDTPRMDYDSIKAYFVDFLQKKPQGVLLESKVIKGDDYLLDAGIYEFTMGATGDKVKARYTYVYTHEDGEWKITHHHSSVMPESFL